MADPVDWTNPCARAEALRSAYYGLLSGQAETLIRYRGPEGEREVRFATIDKATLVAELRAAEAECSAKTGQPSNSRRFAIRGGAMRRCMDGGWA